MVTWSKAGASWWKRVGEQSFSVHGGGEAELKTEPERKGQGPDTDPKVTV